MGAASTGPCRWRPTATGGRRRRWRRQSGISSPGRLWPCGRPCRWRGGRR
ncbi:unnamed protein product [Spirodela intermedia]|uniref:Uncharacterized protein n=1 Tax=Spirodela intermedia TaxID=51605 RepID=A0A7I8JIW0_SPIIN|nr:unnamed protein product [Spirodela intermedia]CAA6669705.1 unnamed protein product [Spirodela intermedia]